MTIFMKKPKLNSASSINTINQCKRKYYYKYKLRLPEEKNIYCVIGIAVHKAIKEKIDNPGLNIEDIFEKVWEETIPEIKKLEVSDEQIAEYSKDCKAMVKNWEKVFDQDAKIKCEVKLISDRYKIIGYIDELIEKNGRIGIMDNKTCSNEIIKPQYRLQLAVYTLLFRENFGKLPDFIGIRFLRTGKKEFIRIDDRLLRKAAYECKLMRLKILSDNMENYPKNPCALCKWSTGECGYYERCKPFNN